MSITNFVDVGTICLRHGPDEPAPAPQSCSLHVKPSKFVLVVGPSDYGKSGLTRLIFGAGPTSDGGVIVASKHLGKPRAQAGTAFQNPACCPGLPF